MRTIIELSEADRMLHAMPLIRLMVENAMTAIRLYLEPRNARAIIKEGFRQRRAAFGTNCKYDPIRLAGPPSSPC